MICVSYKRKEEKLMNKSTRHNLTSFCCNNNNCFSKWAIRLSFSLLIDSRREIFLLLDSSCCFNAEWERRRRSQRGDVDIVWRVQKRFEKIYEGRNDEERKGLSNIFDEWI